MFLYLLLSSIAAGIIATGVMALVLYLPKAWGGTAFDAFGALGSAALRGDDDRKVIIGVLLYFAFGMLFALFYGWAALALLTLPDGAPIPQWRVWPAFPVPIDMIFPILGILMGLVHGVFVGFLLAIVAIEHHPIASYRSNYLLVPLQVLAHVVFGFTVMFFHSQFLQLLLGVRA